MTQDNYDLVSCFTAAKELNDECVEQIQCTVPFGPNGLCNEQNKCSCKPGSHFAIPSRCVLSRGK
jgi:hypothetical protein